MARILIVDDSFVARLMLRKILNKAGYETVTASDGREGMEKIFEYGPDLIITDLLMPEMDGNEFIAALKEKDVKTPIVVMTADIQETRRQRCCDLGVAAFLNKPMKEAELLKTIEQTLSMCEQGQ